MSNAVDQPGAGPDRRAGGAGRPITVTDPADPRLDDFRNLVDTRFRRQFERDGQLAIAEGFPLVERLLTQALPLRTLLTTPESHARLAALGAGPDRVVVAPGQVINEVIGFEFRRGVMGSFARPAVARTSDLIAPARILAVVEGVNDPENLGSIFRTAAAFGIDGVVIDHSTIDPLYRRCVRVSMGATMIVPHAVAGHLPAVIEDLHAAGFSTVALTTNRAARPLTSWDPVPRTAVFLGAEGPGLRPATVKATSAELTIPITDRVDSLNVAHAAAIAFFHLTQP